MPFCSFLSNLLVFLLFNCLKTQKAPDIGLSGLNNDCLTLFSLPIHIQPDQLPIISPQQHMIWINCGIYKVPSGCCLYGQLQPVSQNCAKIQHTIKPGRHLLCCHIAWSCQSEILFACQDYVVLHKLIKASPLLSFGSSRSSTMSAPICFALSSADL